MKFALLYSLNPISLFLYSPSLTSATSASIPWKSSSSKRERERQIDDEAEEKAINASQKKGSLEPGLENVGGGDERKGFLIVVRLFNMEPEK